MTTEDLTLDRPGPSITEMPMHPKIKMEIVEHKGWTEMQAVKTRFPCYFGRWQTIYSIGDKKISLVYLTHNLYGDVPWEIYGFEKVFEDVERYHTRAEAENHIWQYLEK